MQEINAKHTSFSGGEVSPLLHGRSDLQKYPVSLKKCKNFFIHPQGPASNRPGTLYMAGTKNPAKKSRLIPFSFNTKQCYAMEFGEGYIRFFTKDGVVLGIDGKVYEVETDYAEADLPNINYAQSADVVYLACVGRPPKTLTRFEHNEWTFEAYKFKNGPFKPYDGEAKAYIKQSSQTSTINFLAAIYNSQSSYVSSEDGLSWVINKNFTSLKTANGLFFKFYSGKVFTCTDGSSWVERGALPTEKSVYEIVYLNGAYFVSTEYALYRAVDLNSWAELPSASPAILDMNNMVAEGWNLTYLNGTYFAGGIGHNHCAVVLVSENGIDWQKTFETKNPVSLKIKIIFFAGKYIIPGFVSLDGITWTEERWADVGTEGNGVLVRGGEKWVGVNTCGTLMSSVDGVNWTEIMGFGAFEEVASEILFKDGVFYAGGGGRYVGQSYGWILKGTPQDGFKKIATFSDGCVVSLVNVHLEGGLTPMQIISAGSMFGPDIVNTKIKLERDFQSSSISITCGSNWLPSDQLKKVVLCGGSWHIQTHGTWSGTIKMQISKEGKTWTDHKTMTSVGGSSNYEVPGAFSGELYLVRFDVSGRTDGECKLDFTTFSFTGHVYMSAIGYVNPRQIAVELSEDSLPFKEYLDEKEGNLYLGSWSAANGWPSCVCIHQGRVCWGKDFTIDATKVEDYTNFETSIPLVDSDAVSTNVRAGGLNEIRHLISASNLIALTSGGEFKSHSEGFIPSDCGMVPQTNYGADIIRPVKVGGRIVFTQSCGNVLRDMAYIFQSDIYDGSDLCLYAEHLFGNKKVVDMAYQQQPFSLFWVVLDDGTLLCLTYLKEQEVYAWSFCQTDGQVESVCALDGESSTDIFFIVKRGENRFVEKLSRRLPSLNPEDQLFLDCAIAFKTNIETKTISGLEHLEGKIVGILNGGDVEKEQKVEKGRITLSRLATRGFVGLPYEAEMELLPVDLPLSNGSMSAKKYRIKQITITVNQSRGGEVGMSGNYQAEELIYRNGFKNPWPLQSRTFKYPVSGAHETEPTVCVRQRAPMPLTVVSITEQLV